MCRRWDSACGFALVSICFDLLVHYANLCQNVHRIRGGRSGCDHLRKNRLRIQPGVIITIARQHGSAGKQIGKLVAQRLGIPFYYKEMIALAAHESGLDAEFISDIHKNSPDLLRDLYLSTGAVCRAIDAQKKIIQRIADNGSCVIVGRAAGYVLRDYGNVVRVFIHAPVKYRMRHVMEIYGDTPAEAKRNIRRSDKARGAYYHHISGKHWNDGKNYRLVLDSSVGIDKTVDTIVNYISDIDKSLRV